MNYEKAHNEKTSRTLDSNPKASRQAPIDVILQRYKERDIQRYVEDEELIQGEIGTVQREEVLQGKFDVSSIIQKKRARDMYAQVEKLKESRDRVIVHSVAQNKSNVKQGFELVDNRLEDKQSVQLQEAMSVSGGIMQRFVMKYGDLFPIPEDAEIIANAQNAKRGKDIEIHNIPDKVPDDVYDKMSKDETVYIVAHGLAPVGNNPAILEHDRNGGKLSGIDVAKIISDLKMGLEKKGKSIGIVKIEACMSSLSRKTQERSLFRFFASPKPSLLTDIQTSLKKDYKVDGVELIGNPGFVEGTDFTKGGIRNTSLENTEIGLLAKIGTILCDVPDDSWGEEANQALRNDGLYILEQYSNVFKSLQINSSSAYTVFKAFLSANENTENQEIKGYVHMVMGHIYTTLI